MCTLQQTDSSRLDNFDIVLSVYILDIRLLRHCEGISCLFYIQANKQNKIVRFIL